MNDAQRAEQVKIDSADSVPSRLRVLEGFIESVKTHKAVQSWEYLIF